MIKETEFMAGGFSSHKLMGKHGRKNIHMELIKITLMNSFAKPVLKCAEKNILYLGNIIYWYSKIYR